MYLCILKLLILVTHKWLHWVFIFAKKNGSDNLETNLAKHYC